jgi:hypothetical protein
MHTSNVNPSARAEARAARKAADAAAHAVAALWAQYIGAQTKVTCEALARALVYASCEESRAVRAYLEAFPRLGADGEPDHWALWWSCSVATREALCASPQEAVAAAAGALRAAAQLRACVASLPKKHALLARTLGSCAEHADRAAAQAQARVSAPPFDAARFASVASARIGALAELRRLLDSIAQADAVGQPCDCLVGEFSILWLGTWSTEGSENV